MYSGQSHHDRTLSPRAGLALRKLFASAVAWRAIAR